MTECILHGGRLGGEYCGPDCDRLTQAQMASETPAEPAGRIDQLMADVGSEEDVARLDLSWPEFRRLLEQPEGDLVLEDLSAMPGGGGSCSLPRCASNEWAWKVVEAMRAEAS